MKLTFLGAAGTVTGSKYLIERNNHRVLVDCGLFQGVKSLRERNWNAPPFDPRTLDAVVLTHAHLDHSGYLPVLLKRGFRGPIHGSAGTRALCGVLLPDSGHLQEEAARYANLKGFSKHSPAIPLYTKEEAKETLRLFQSHRFNKPFNLAPGISCELHRAGHILGAASVRLFDGAQSIAFSGDVGRPVSPVLLPPAAPPPCDWLVVESTYGNRLHASGDGKAELAEIIRRTADRGGVLLIPSFAVGRSQSLLHHLSEILKAPNAPKLPVFMDSPMAIRATEIYCHRDSEFRLSQQQSKEMCNAATFLQTPEESMSLNDRTGPYILLSASGMATGGRVLHHLKRLLPEQKNTILFSGFQAAGTRGEALVHGASEIKIHGRYFPVRAEIQSLDALSAHADRAELLDWLREIPRPPKRTFITHGEASASDALRLSIKDHLGWAVTVPTDSQSFELKGQPIPDHV